MTQREKLLAGLVGLTLVVAVAAVMARQVSSMFNQRSNQEDSLRATIRSNELTLHRAAKATKKLADFRQRSLPPNSDHATNLHKQWLLQVCQDVGLAKTAVTPLTESRFGAMDEVRITVTGEGTLDQLTKLLHRFYSSADLHRIRRLDLTPLDTKRLKIAMTTEALLVPQAEQRTVVGNLPAPSMKDKPVEQYLATIVPRNLFGPANQAPSLVANQDQSATVGQSLEFGIKASDPETDSLTYAFEGEPPPGMSIDPEKGTVRWRPERAGEVQVTVRVSDAGVPSLSDTKTLKVVVRDPPPKSDPPTLDDAQFAQMVAVLDANNERQLWIHVRTKGEMLKLNVGDSLHVGTFDGVVASIGLNSAELTTKEGTVSIEMGQMLTDVRPVRKTAAN